MTVFNEDGASATSTSLLISVDPANQVPVSEEGTFITDANVPIDIPLRYSDPDGGPGPYTVTIQSQPTEGILTGEDTSWMYSPDMGFVGNDSFMWSVNDGAGESPISLITISIVDDEDPVFLECPSNISIVSGEDSCMTSVTWNEPVAEDNVSMIKLSSNYASGDTFSVGQTVISYTAEDSSANTAVCDFSIHVIPAQLPVLSGCPSDISVVNAPGWGGAFVDWDVPTVNHECEGVSISSDHQPGDFYPAGTTLVQYSFLGASGQSDACSFSIDVDFELQLTQGWNTISLPKEPLMSPKEIFGENLMGHVWKWEDQHYQIADLIEPNRAYWMYSRSSTNVRISDFLEDISDNDFFLLEGWNLFGPKNLIEDPYEAYMEGLIWRWNGKEFEAVPTPQGVLQSGEGYWIYSEGIFQYP